MRLILALSLSIVPAIAQAWQVSLEDGICVLNHESPAGDLRMTYDPSGPIYSISLTTETPWPDAPVFSIAFEGLSARTISTTAHILDDGGRRLTVRDTGFGNVLDGLEFNAIATASTGLGQMQLDLSDARPAIREFRACTATPLA